MSDRKYRQRGYQDDARPTSRESSSPGPVTERREGPRGRGLGAPTEAVIACPQCSHQLPVSTAIDSATLCPRCRAPLRCCGNCRFFDPASRFECRQPVGERVANKRAANACPVFDPRTVQTHAAEPASVPNDPRAAFEALFRK